MLRLNANDADASDVERADEDQEQRPALRLQAQHHPLVDREDLAPGQDLRRDGVPGAWEVSSVRWPRDTAVLGIAWTVTTKNYLQLYVNYDATLGNGVFDNGFGGGFRLVW